METKNGLKIFNNPQFGDIRTAGTPDNPTFCLADICKALNLSASHVKERLSDDVVSTDPIVDSLGRKQMANFINEDGLYDGILDSRQPQATSFRRWVTGAVLPSIRKTGGYIAASNDMTDEEIMARALVVAQTTIQRRDEKIRQLEQKASEQADALHQQELQIASMSDEIVEMKKKTDYLEIILSSVGSVTTTQIAQDYGMSAVAFNKQLEKMRIQRKVNGQWILYAPYISEGYIKSKTIDIVRSDGRPDTVMHTEWRQKGRLFLYNKLKEVGILPLIERQTKALFTDDEQTGQ